MNKSEFINTYLAETAEIAQSISREAIEKAIEILLEIKSQKGRVFFIGVGGGAGTGSHATNDFNKIAKISALCLSDNPSLLTALTNDEGWDSVFKRQLEMHNFTSRDCLFIYSVGGGTETVSKNLILAINYAKKVGARIIGVVGKDTGATAKEADVCIIVPCPDDSRRTPHTEDFQLVMDHLLVNILAKIENEANKE
ncbi:SIS domain-containing protein [bacterium]|nr:SIS domain-containing protein [bacterium]